MNRKFVAIITAGGSGKRLKNSKKKQFIEILNRPLLYWTIDPFYKHPMISTIVISLPEDELDNHKCKILSTYPGKEIICIAGGKERQSSVLKALKNCPENTDFVLIHDGVRPFINENLITAICTEVEREKAVIPASPVKYTIKKVNNGTIKETVNRKDLYNAMTPQAFDYQLILKFHEEALKTKTQFTDDASILEYYRQKVTILETTARNFKVTEPFDFELAKIIIEKQHQE